MVACFVQLLRNCINQNGFEVITGITPIEDQNTGSATDGLSGTSLVLQHLDEIDHKRSKLFTQQNGADVIPHFANIFLQQYLPAKCNIFPERHAITLFEHLGLWLQQRKFTNYKLIKLSNDYNNSR